MRILALILLLCCLSCSAAVDTKDGAAITKTSNIDGATSTWGKIDGQTPKSGVSYLLQENFDGAGYQDADWTEAGTGTLDEGYTSTILEGTESFYCNLSAQTGRTTNSFTASGTVEFYFLIRFVSIPASARNVVHAHDSSAGQTGLFLINSTGTLQVRGGGGSGVNTVGTVTAGTTYHVWLRFVKGTGANCFGSIGFSTDGVRPVSGNNYAESTNGTSTTDTSRMVIGSPSGASSTIEFIIDKVRVDDVAIGDNPS